MEIWVGDQAFHQMVWLFCKGHACHAMHLVRSVLLGLHVQSSTQRCTAYRLACQAMESAP